MPSFPKLAPEDVDSWIARHEGWERVSVDSIARKFKLKDFAAALAFVNTIGAEADKHDHHPDIELGYGRARVLWTTHDAGGVTKKDLELAELTDTLSASAPAKA
jgi:4a-hydroxytetrahydrobiopterin dehydratase